MTTEVKEYSYDLYVYVNGFSQATNIFTYRSLADAKRQAEEIKNNSQFPVICEVYRVIRTIQKERIEGI